VAASLTWWLSSVSSPCRASRAASARPAWLLQEAGEFLDGAAANPGERVVDDLPELDGERRGSVDRAAAAAM